MNVFQTLRDSLVPQGQSDLVCLKPYDPFYFRKSFIDKVISELEKKGILVFAKMDEFTSCEILCLELLMDKAGIKKESM